MLDHRFASHVEYRRSRTCHTFTMSAYFPNPSGEDDDLHRFIIVMGTCKDPHSPSAQAPDADRNVMVPCREPALNGFTSSGLGIVHRGRITSPKPQSGIPDACSDFGRLSNDLMFSKRLRTLRLRQNLSLFELAERSDLPVQFLADCEQGRQQPNGIMLQRLAVALGVQSRKLSFSIGQ